MNIRQADTTDWEPMMRVRLAVKENVLINTGAVSMQHFNTILENGGCSWICEEEGEVLGFAIVDLANQNIWALFVHPDHEQRGIGAQLHRTMLDWSFTQGKELLYLTTDPGTRAEVFYLKAGWEYMGLEENGELRFEITREKWLEICHAKAENKHTTLR